MAPTPFPSSILLLRKVSPKAEAEPAFGNASLFGSTASAERERGTLTGWEVEEEGCVGDAGEEGACSVEG